MNRRALSPLVATVLLIAFAVALGAVIMSLGKSYVESLPGDGATVEEICDSTTVTEPFKLLQIDYINGKLTKAQYLEQAKKYG